MTNRTYRIVLDCPDQVGIVTRVGEIIASNGGWISEASHHSDVESKWFFSRLEVQADSLLIGPAELEQKFAQLKQELNLNLRIEDTDQPKRVVLMASKGSHCMSDLLDRWKSGDLHCEIPCVISNHEDMRGLVEWYGIPFHHVVIDKDDKTPGFAKVEELVDEYQADCVVLARYMQILPQALCEKLRHKVINIHHSFLPSFIGARPYHQASRRGVKLIGATCHYVTEQLDEGPIIDQDVVRVSHSDKVEDLVRLGKDVEKTVLARGLRAHLEDRVLVHGNQTVVFN
ncbi:formyltetrahydrofolate deformylase [Amphritea balenae]|uniref:Formyltetrahydrofolate deformylase n=1 Tax=Amphritea balenae TaxID=452629 RepID=A0A3P1SQD6_9GAMM|nr:formyltetrahydrofolate deformylase [Amphritea balenae]RRC99333.1 formyltetrahydrofolate deformylase [Amphritea balenae]GGK71969.1 formyltetrahydrofolate deformylase [Amphritea balenae]